MTGQPALVRAIGRWSLTAAIVNGVIGSGIFGAPSGVAGFVGAWSPLAVLVAGCSVFVVVLSFAEVGSRFDETGGPYLYTRDAFGSVVGFQVGWLHIWTRLLSGAAALNVLVAYLAALTPAVGTPAGRVLAMTGATAIVTALNVRGVRQATWTVNAFTIAKLLPLLLLIVLGLLHLNRAVLATQAVRSPNWTEAVLLLFFAYGGFESAVVAAGETVNPKRDTAFALCAGIAGVTLVYCLVQLAVVGLLPHAARSGAPVAAALGEVLGGTGSVLGSVAAVVSISGWLMGFALMTPRILLSMAERKELPAVFARVHPRFRTPYAAIIANSIAALGLGLFSSFTDAATLAVIARLGIFGLTCASVIVFRRRWASGFVVSGGPIVPVAGVALCVWLLSTRSLAQAWMLAAIMASGAMLWGWSRLVRYWEAREAPTTTRPPRG